MYMLIDQSILQGFNNYCKANTHSQSETKYDQLIKFATLKQLSTLKGRLLQLIQAVVSVVPQNQTYWNRHNYVSAYLDIYLYMNRYMFVYAFLCILVHRT